MAYLGDYEMKPLYGCEHLEISYSAPRADVAEILQSASLLISYTSYFKCE
jgi:hypothetical protein